MRVTTVFNRVLGLAATRVIGVRLEHDSIVATVESTKRVPVCPCGHRTWSIYDRRTRRWRHLDACGTRIVLEAEIRRIDCRGCGKVRSERVPWARPGGRHTYAFENMVLWCARRMDKTAVAELMRIAWSTVDIMIGRAAGDPASQRLDGLRRIGVDEISYKRGHHFLTVVCDHDSGDVVWACEGKDAAALTSFYTALGPERCAQLEAVSMDLGIAYRHATRRAAPQARICADPFHLLKLASETIDVVRQRTRSTTGRDPQLRWALLKRPDHLNDHQQQLLDQLATNETDAWRTWAHREQLRDILHTTPDNATSAIDDWLTTAAASTVIPIRNLARRFHAHRDLIINTIQLRLSNGRLEGTNSKIRLLNHRGYGHHKPDALIALIYLCCTTGTAR